MDDGQAAGNDVEQPEEARGMEMDSGEQEMDEDDQANSRTEMDMKVKEGSDPSLRRRRFDKQENGGT